MRAADSMSIDRMFKAVKASKELVFDIETTGVDWKRHFAVGYVITVGLRPEDTYYVPVRHGGGRNISKGHTPDGPEDVGPRVLPFEKRFNAEIASRTDLLVVGHHLKFDLHMAANHGIIFNGPLECTMVNAALIDENVGKYSLADCAKRAGVTAKLKEEINQHIAEKFKLDPKDRGLMAHYWRLSGDDKMAIDYASGDGVTTWELHKWQQIQLDSQDLRRVWAVECRVLRTLFRMERHGVRVDESRLLQLKEEMEKKLEKALTALPENMNVRSAPEVRKFVRDKLGRTDFPLTPKGNPSFPEQYLLTFEEGRRVIAARKITTIINSFITPTLDRHLWKGRVHCNFNQLKGDEYGTVTGRLSSDSPTMQQVPNRDKELAPLFRSVFVPDEGTKWSTNDFKQQEPVVLTEYTQCKALVKGYNSDPPVDIHSVVAKMIGVERDPTAKRMNMGMLNGMGKKLLAKHLGVDIDVATEYRDQYDRAFPEAMAFMKSAERRAVARGYVKTFLGRRRRFPRGEFAYKAGNSVVQGSSADITKVKMVEIDDYLKSVGRPYQMLLQVHDSLDWLVEEGARGQTINGECLKIMQDFGPDQLVHLVLVPLRVDGHVGDSWGDAIFGED